jgi:hypothetical protein
MRRWRLGPGTASYSPFLLYPADQREDWLDREVEAIAVVLQQEGALSRDELARRVGARYWGPGRFRAALAEGLAEGRIRRAGRSAYAPLERSREPARG